MNKEEKAEDEIDSIKSINSNQDRRLINKNITIVTLDPKKNFEGDNAGAAVIESDDFNINQIETTAKIPEK